VPGIINPGVQYHRNKQSVAKVKCWLLPESPDTAHHMPCSLLKLKFHVEFSLIRQLSESSLNESCLCGNKPRCGHDKNEIEFFTRVHLPPLRADFFHFFKERCSKSPSFFRPIEQTRFHFP
jgi:hypothetical protein